MFCGGRCCELSKGGERSLAMARQHHLDLIPRSGAALVGPSTVLVHSQDLVDHTAQKSHADVAPSSGTSSHAATGGSALSPDHQSEGLQNREDRSRIADAGLERLALARNDGAAWPMEISREWEAVRCTGCGELVGIEQVEGRRRGLYGAHLFKHRVSTTRDPNSSENLWRRRTLEVSVAAELKSLATMNSCHRIVVRGLHTHSPVALVVLLNVDARMAFGRCLAVAAVSAVRQDADRSDRSADGKPGATDGSRDAEDSIPEGGDWEWSRGGCEGKRPEDDVMTDAISGEELGEEAGGLETVVKLMFYDCSCSQEGQVPFGGVENWAKQQSTEDIYMVDSEATEWLRLLRSNSNRLPASSRRFQQFLLSFLRT